MSSLYQQVAEEIAHRRRKGPGRAGGAACRRGPGPARTGASVVLPDLDPDAVDALERYVFHRQGMPASSRPEGEGRRCAS